MKKQIAVILCVLLVLTLAGCGKKTTLRATVTSVEDGEMLVTPVEGSKELDSTDCICISLQALPVAVEPEVGSTVEITYNGKLSMTSPATLGEIYTMSVVG